MPAIPALSQAPASEWLDADDDTLRPSQRDAPTPSPVAMLRGHRPWRALVAIAAVACVGLISLVVSAIGSAPDTVAELPQTRPTPAPSPAPAAPAPPAVTATPDNAAGFADSFKAALASSKAPVEAPAMTAVTVRVVPSDALVIKSGRRLGKGNVTVNVAPGTKVTLVAQRDGYTTRTLVIDGSYNSVNIALKRARTTQSGPQRNTGRR